MSNGIDIEKSQKKRRIFCVITQGDMGGAQQFLLQLAGNIDPEKFDMHVVWGAQTGRALSRGLPAWVTCSAARHLVREIAPLHDVRAISELRSMMREYQTDVALLLSSKAGFVGARAARPLDIPVVYRIGGWAFNDPRSAWEKQLYITLERISARWKNTIVVNNEHDLQQALEFGIKPRSQLLCIHNGIDPYLPLLPRAEAQAFLQSKLPPSSQHLTSGLIVGTIANFYPAKGLETLIDAAARVQGDARFYIIGDGALHTKLAQRIAARGLHDRVFLLGSIPKASQYLSAIDLFVLPSLKEGFPWALLEAMAAKVPVIATRVGAVPEMIEDHQSGIIVPPGNPGALAQAIIELASDERARAELPIRAHQQVIAKFSLREMIAKFEQLLDN